MLLSFINKYSLSTFKFETISTESQNLESIGIENELGITDCPSGVRLALCRYAALNTAVLVDREILVEGSPVT